MLKLYTQFGELRVCDKNEFLSMVPHENLGPKISIPYSVPVMSSELPEFTFKLYDVDLANNLQFFSNKHFGEHDIMDVMLDMVENYASIDTIYAVIIGKNFYIYSEPVVYEFAGRYQVVSKGFQDVYSCSIEKSGLMDKIKRFKATRLAKKMFPDLLEVDGWLYSC